MRLRKTIQRASIAVLLVAVLAIVIAKLCRDDKTDIGKTLTFSDGSAMTLRAVTYGKENRYPGDTTLDRFLSILPNKVTRKFLSNKNIMDTGNVRPQIVFWLKHTGLGPAQDPKLILCDANGFETSGNYTMMRLGAMGNSVEGWAFPYWPRRDQTFKLRIYEQGKRYPDAKPIGEFVVRNPTPGNYPTWKPSPLPITSRVGNLAVTLFDLTAGVGHGSNKWKPAANATVSETRAGFRLEENGHPTKDWEIVSVETSDATGNLIWGTGGGGEYDGALYADLRTHPWPAESAWKLRVGFARTANFEPTDLWRLHIPVSESGETNSKIMQTNLHGVLLEYAGYDLRKYGHDGHEFTFKMKRPENRWFFDYQLSVAKAVDNTGHAAELKATASRDWDKMEFTLNLSSNATSLDLTVALVETRYVEFLAPPRIIASTNDAPH